MSWADMILITAVDRAKVYLVRDISLGAISNGARSSKRKQRLLAKRELTNLLAPVDRNPLSLLCALCG